MPDATNPPEVEERSTDDLERLVLDAVAMEPLVSWLGELIAIPSLAGQERAPQDPVAAALRRIALAVDAWDLGFVHLRAHPLFNMKVERSEGRGVVGHYEGADLGGA